MSCWVVPNVAAELWGMSLAEVMQAVRDGHAACKIEQGVQLIDVTPTGNTICRPAGCTPTQHPPTHKLVSAMEVEELLAPLGGEGENPYETFDWRRARTEASFRRKAPGTFPLLRVA